MYMQSSGVDITQLVKSGVVKNTADKINYLIIEKLDYE